VPATRSSRLLLDTALAAIADSGLDGLTLSAIAERAGVSRATAYREFGDKDGLINAVAQREVQRMLAAGSQHVDLSAAIPTLAGDAVLFALGYLRDHAAITYLRTHEPHWLLDAVIQHDGARLDLVAIMSAAIAPMIATKPTDDLAVRPEQAAEIAVRTVLAHTLLPASHLTAPQVADTVVRAITHR